MQKRTTCTRPHTANGPPLRSHYCPAEMGRPQRQGGSRLSRTASHTAQSTRTPDTNCDVTFLRKLLAMNKKEELLLNKKLAKLLVEEEFRTSEVGTGKNFKGCTSSSALASNTQHLFVNNIVRGSSSRNTGFLCQPRFDMHGRRVFDDSDEDDKENNCKVEPSVEFTSAESKTWINTTTVIKTKSDVSGKMCSNKNAMTVINRLPSLQTVSDERKRVEEVHPHKSPFTTNDGTYQNNRSLEACADEEAKERRLYDRDEVLGNVVAHCCVVVPTKTKQMARKVWDFKEIPKTKPENTSQYVRKLYKTVGYDSISCYKGDGNTKTIKEDRNCKLKSSRTQIFPQGDGRIR